MTIASATMMALLCTVLQSQKEPTDTMKPVHAIHWAMWPRTLESWDTQIQLVSYAERVLTCVIMVDLIIPLVAWAEDNLAAPALQAHVQAFPPAVRALAQQPQLVHLKHRAPNFSHLHLCL